MTRPLVTGAICIDGGAEFNSALVSYNIQLVGYLQYIPNTLWSTSWSGQFPLLHHMTQPGGGNSDKNTHHYSDTLEGRLILII